MMNKIQNKIQNDYKINFLEEKLSNGLNVIYHQDKRNPIIYTSVLYHVGSKNEDPGKTGFAHFFEHLMFEGSKHIKKGDYYKYIASNGGQNNAYTNQDETYYYEVMPSNCLPIALWLESERMFYAKLDKDSIDLQREVVKEEKKMRFENQPYVKALSEVIPSLLFKKHPYKYPIIGYDKDLDSATEKDYEKFYNTYYAPNNATLVVTGDFELNDAKELVNKYFSFYSSSKSNCKKTINFPIEDPINEEIKSTFFDRNAKIPGIFLSYRTSNITHDDFYKLKIIDYIISSGESSRIINNIVNIKQLAAYAGSSLDVMEDYGIFTIYGIINHGISLDKLLEEIDKEIEYFKEKGITQYELDKQMNFFEKGFIYDNYFMSGIASNLSHYHLYYKNTNLINTIMNHYKNVTILDVQKVANKYLNKTNRVCLYNIPEYLKSSY
ncbi:M16 family metallopeptidase [Blattabacterium cuenoti]|uniref:M16 family metallopeptidase n=1 Tax=Blattabacterium cuenoti TaxID=1653831 RepID=UPI00163C8839|nr:pitrilysin family protein [Blattabacterium cuenoti]